MTKFTLRFSNIAILLLIAFSSITLQSQESDLSVEKIMQDPKWMGTFPSRIQWGIESENIYFQYNLENDPDDSLYKIDLSNQSKILKVSQQEKENMIPRYGDYNDKKTEMLFTENGKLFLYNIRKASKTELIDLGERIIDPQFMANESKISFILNDNAFIYDLDEGTITKLTNINSGKKREGRDEKLSDKNQWIQDENLDLLEVVNERKEKSETSKSYRESVAQEEDYAFYAGDKQISGLSISPNGKYVSFNLIKRERGENTDVPNYVDQSGYTKDLPARSKVGDDKTEVELALYNIEKDTVFMVSTAELEGIKDLPDYVKDYPDKEWEEKVREVITSPAYFSENGEKAIVSIRSKDNKDRWIAQLDLENGSLTTIDRQRDEAWIAGPGLGWSFGGGTIGWLPDNKHIYFQSEATGYSHLYLLNVDNGDKKDLTPGEYEVFDPELSNNKKYWYLTTSAEGPDVRHFYKMPVMGGKMEKLTNMTGNNQVYLSPDEKYMAIYYSFSNKPWELYLKKTGKAEAKQLTSGQSEAFASYDWRTPELIKFEAEDGAMVPARLYTPSEETKNDAAVVFVHGAGYLQNVHQWWSSYFREYMFHNLLTDLGYTVIDIDYRGSAGYGRDWRTGIYRHMGGKDLSDQVDGVKYLVENHGINPEKIGIYGGSYGGFITLMAMFNEPDTFAAGAALRSVTDWAHYNHGYTSNILNEPVNDPIAYRRSSPIYFAEGLEGDLLIAHGMVDVNVHFQDVVRLSQRLIELGKDNWEMAVYPVEDHGFVEPSSWTDEYSRILKLFNESLLDK
ncbi:Dipeptidyl aminopeptidase/acylaminoacyl peptidase [Zunongwangia mangrovi]|uniref:Dipeptidyl aminopeptidase/acylaminoacyl peptidase n=1 Tax=Zunongwangia mangrovi TaxID=1334022 RepID=A0A1I1DE72_9FLAO|nr:prolyl oligopeptidase family serine peptidase [Zunongwangia mangrovi]SFB73201.1 Dipeptidyl aminopeptidase/acylaminoacyl peptidase [Zunongwangia mangrovi]